MNISFLSIRCNSGINNDEFGYPFSRLSNCYFLRLIRSFRITAPYNHTVCVGNVRRNNNSKIKLILQKYSWKMTNMAWISHIRCSNQVCKTSQVWTNYVSTMIMAMMEIDGFRSIFFLCLIHSVSNCC